MAYARFFDSDVYVYCVEKDRDDNPTLLECCRCQLGEGIFPASSAEEMFWHLVVHALFGHDVPEEALERLMHEAERQQAIEVFHRDIEHARG